MDCVCLIPRTKCAVLHVHTSHRAPAAQWSPDIHQFMDALQAPDSSCAICLEPFDSKQLVRLLPTCGHVFHGMAAQHRSVVGVPSLNGLGQGEMEERKRVLA